ncbi:YHYH protein [Aquimarina sp. SS2-1]|uniref:YHYH protein n=1 Tax=Aquimarina besae TaxID=3342247 RepID=UPI00366C141E
MKLKIVTTVILGAMVLCSCGKLVTSENQDKAKKSNTIETINRDERSPREPRMERPEGGRRKYEPVETAQGKLTPLTAFDEFNPNSVTVSFDGSEITIESTGLPNHTTPYWQETDSLYIKPVVAVAQTPGRIGSHRDRSFMLTVSSAPGLAVKSTTTGLGPIGISVTGAPIFNDSEGPNRPLEEKIAETFDYAGGHVGPSGYHYHSESMGVPENTILSHDDEKLVGIMADGFLIYGRKEPDGSYPNDLDKSGGHFGVTPHSNGETNYHYHIINEYYFGNLIVLFGGEFMGSPNNIM